MTQLQTTWQTLLDDLNTQRNQIVETIRNYPPPIPACDAQFNYLLEKRDRITVELHRLEHMKSNLSPETMNTFIKDSSFVTEDLQLSVKFADSYE